jgi:hypothetical protein
MLLDDRFAGHVKHLADQQENVGQTHGQAVLISLQEITGLPVCLGR